MGYKDILVYVDGSRASADGLAAAARLARAQDARLVALHVTPPPFLSSDLGPGAIAEMVRWQEQREAELMQAAEKQVAAVRQQSGVAVEWRTDKGEIEVVTELHSRYADLVAVGRASPDDVDAVAADYLPETMLMESARPVLIVPPGFKAATVGERVLVAWNRSREASRAVHDALPVLRRAKAVTVFEANPAPTGSPHVVGAELAQHLARHGATANVETVNVSGAEIGRTMLARGAALGADLIVAGAYGHSRLREYVLGGVTRELLRHAPIPLLMSR